MVRFAVRRMRGAEDASPVTGEQGPPLLRRGRAHRPPVPQRDTPDTEDVAEHLGIAEGSFEDAGRNRAHTRNLTTPPGLAPRGNSEIGDCHGLIAQ